MEFLQVTFEQRHMNTDFRFTVACRSERLSLAETTLAECMKKIAELENALSEFRGPVKELNESAPGLFLKLPEATLRCLKESFHLRAKSAGAFDPLAKSMGPSGIKIEGQNAARLTSGTHLSFAAVGKGFALDEAALLLEREGFSDYLLEAGGSSILLSGRPAPRESWVFGWSWARDAAGTYLGKRFRHESGERIAFGISGTLEQGKHILDPRSGREANGALSAFVAHASAARADALSTALFVDGLAGRDRLEALDASFALVDEKNQARWNASFESHWGPVC
jgi:thiamine biosynthesis lipoprotein ApbE